MIPQPQQHITPSHPPLSRSLPFFFLTLVRLCYTQLFLDKKELSVTTDGEKEQVILGRAAVFKFTALQCVCLAALWALKLSPATALIFPSVIGVLMVVRVKFIPKLFSSRELMLLDTAIGQVSA